MSLRGDFDQEAWTGFCCLFFLCWQSVARADGTVDENEDAVLDQLVGGQEASNLLPTTFHNRFDTSSDLAQEVLAFPDEDRKAFLSFVATSRDEGELAQAALRTDQVLPLWISDARDSKDEWYRAANAQGLRMEAFHFALRVARASGGRFRGPKMSDEEQRALGKLARILEITREQLGAIVASTGGIK